MKRWLLCCHAYSTDPKSSIPSKPSKSRKSSSTESLCHYASSDPDSLTIDSLKEFQFKLDLIKKELKRTEKFRNQPLSKQKPSKIISTEFLPIYKECDGKLISLGTSKTVVFTDS